MMNCIYVERENKKEGSQVFVCSIFRFNRLELGHIRYRSRKNGKNVSNTKSLWQNSSFSRGAQFRNVIVHRLEGNNNEWPIYS